jgi:hypothetical protein
VKQALFFRHWLPCCLTVVGLAACSGGGKQEIPLSSGQTYQLQTSGKLTVFPAGASEAAPGAIPIQKLRVKRKNDVADGSKTEGCWRCSDCICNSDDCSCTECTAC